MKVFDTLTDVAGIYPLFSVLQKWKSKKMTTSEKSKKPVKYTIRGKVDRKKERKNCTTRSQLGFDFTVSNLFERQCDFIESKLNYHFTQTRFGGRKGDN